MTTAHPIISIDPRSGVPFYRQIIDRILMGVAGGDFKPGDRLPTVRKLAIDLQVNPNTVSRAYRELEIRQVLTTQRGTGTFVAAEPGVAQDQAKRLEFLEKICDEFVAEAGKFGFSLRELVAALNDRLSDRR
ncbi:MAG: GntR family transcriptional regulator [Phycisphaerales bacterium]|nr:GntR family transcriptional regulator [Phycisphaerales bacterium]